MNAEERFARGPSRPVADEASFARTVQDRQLGAARGVQSAKRRKGIVIRLAMVGTMVGLVVVGGCANQEDSLRIGTFNAQFIPSTFNGMPPGDDVARPKQIAARILAGGYDIIALNEVFDEDSRKVFVRELRGAYPHYVAYLGDDAVASEDSGLMLFSRFPFVGLPLKTHIAEPDDLKAQNGGSDWKDVAFIEYDASSDSDDMSAKGAAMVRIQNPHTQRIYNIVFTHMQASYPEEELIGLCPAAIPGPGGTDRRLIARGLWGEHIDIRNDQLGDIRRVIEDSLPPGAAGREDVIVLGDLNVDGDRADPNLGPTGWCRPNLFEWAARFDTPGSFFKDGIKDAWANEHPKQDRGLTNLYHWAIAPDPGNCASFEPETGARLDFILRNRPDVDRRLVVQHLTRAFNLRDGAPFSEGGLGMAGITDLSDHIGLNADVNRWAPHCNPLEAMLNPALDAFLGGTITFPGSMQWVRFDAAGTYAFAIPTAGTEFRVYKASELSVPVPQYFEETITFAAGGPARQKSQITGKKFHLPEPPLFVRIFKPARTETGPYTFVAHRATCTSQNEACVLGANDPVLHSLPAAPQNADDTSWFEMHLQRATSGAPQSLRLFADGFPSEDFEIELRAADGVTVIDSASGTIAGPGGRRVEINRPEVGAAKMFLLVKRKTLAVTSFRVGWETNLIVFHGIQAGIPDAANFNVYCIEETDTVGIDEVSLSVIADGATIVDDVFIGDFDNGRHRSLEDVIPVIRFINSVTIRLRDEDDAANGGDDIMEVTVPALPPDKTSALNETRSLSCCGGAYTVRFNRSRSLPKDVP